MNSGIFWLSKPEIPVFKAGPLTMIQSTSTTPALSSLNGKPILLNFDGAEMRCRNRARPDWHRGALIDGSM